MSAMLVRWRNAAGRVHEAFQRLLQTAMDRGTNVIVAEARLAAVRQSIEELAVMLEQPLPIEVPPGHVRVRIAVAVTLNQDWRAWGAHGAGDLVSRDLAAEGLEDDEVVHFVEADIPIPQRRVVEGVVT